ncbi:ABC transporter substrate-binding protein [Streptomyces cacaoi]|uniref:Extracellular solute-binding protein n=1 Tax=Streptomyces cacaoi TaxID=1898 RepID=A0A4Y3R300_STRCI|nr:extracellular solute-binding protein [Streptomyces cacaoi]NNG88269.1 extracellular solute-binding protein [Streptomyces cacaoi]GEB51287.1 hypothetical protein SCA03_38380 [Streptomyces cacaoi]
MAHPWTTAYRPGRRALCGALLAAPLTGCAALTPGSGPDTSRTRTVPRATAVPAGDVTLRLTFADAPEMVDALIAAFHKRHPNVRIEPAYTQFADYVKSLKLTMASETAPDLAQFAVGMNDVAARGDILDLTPYRDAYGWRERFPATALDQLAGSGPGAGRHLFGVPAGLSMTGIYYDKRRAARAGVRRPPRTLDEFEAQLAAARRAGMTPLGVGALDSGGLHLWAGLINNAMPPRDYRAWVKGEPGATIRTPATLRATRRLVDWSRRGYLSESANGTTQVDSTGGFIRGGSAGSVFLVNGNWAAGQVAEAMGERAGFFLMPAERAHARAMASGFSVSYAISARTRHPQAAGAFLDFLASRASAKLVSGFGFLPPDGPGDTSVPVPEGVLGEVARAHRRVTADDGMNHFPDFTAPDMLDPLRAGVQKLIADRTTPGEFLDSLQDVWREHYSRGGGR